MALDFPGYAIGGLSVGETPDEMYRVLDATVPALPSDRPRYLMGVGRPQDLIEGVARGIDMFDCVMPTRNARNALAFTRQRTGAAAQPQARSATPGRLEEDCPCPACRHSRAYLRHLFMASEMLGPTLLTIAQPDVLSAINERSRRGDCERIDSTTWRQAQHRAWNGSERARKMQIQGRKILPQVTPTAANC